MEYLVTATLSTGKTLTGGVIEAETPDAAIEIAMAKYVELFGPTAFIMFAAQEAPDDEEDESC
jgi:hypothetical protein